MSGPGTDMGGLSSKKDPLEHKSSSRSFSGAVYIHAHIYTDVRIVWTRSQLCAGTGDLLFLLVTSYLCSSIRLFHHKEINEDRAVTTMTVSDAAHLPSAVPALPDPTEPNLLLQLG